MASCSALLRLDKQIQEEGPREKNDGVTAKELGMKNRHALSWCNIALEELARVQGVVKVVGPALAVIGNVLSDFCLDLMFRVDLFENSANNPACLNVGVESIGANSLVSPHFCLARWSCRRFKRVF